MTTASAAATSVPLPFAPADVRLGVIGSGAGLYQAMMAVQALGVPVVAVATQRSAQEEAQSQELQGYRQRGWYGNLDEAAQRMGARFLRTPDLNSEDSVRALKACGASLIVSVSAQILRAEFVRAFAGFVFNIHGSAVYRGRAGLSWAILNGLQADRIVLHWVAQAIDAGPVVVERPYAWPAGCYPIDIMAAQFQAYRLLLADFAAILRDGWVPCADHGDNAKLYFPLIRGERDGLVPWDWAPEAVETFVRAFGWPYAGALGCVRDSRGRTAAVHLARCQPVKDDARSFHPFCNGVPVRYGPGGSVDIVAGGRLLRLLTVRNGWDEAPARTAVRLGGRFVSAPALAQEAEGDGREPEAVRHFAADVAGVGGGAPTHD